MASKSYQNKWNIHKQSRLPSKFRSLPLAYTAHFSHDQTLKKTQSSLLKRLLKTSTNVTCGSRPCILLDGRIVPEQAGALGGLQWRPFLGTNLSEGLGTGCSASCSFCSKCSGSFPARKSAQPGAQHSCDSPPKNYPPKGNFLEPVAG